MKVNFKKLNKLAVVPKKAHKSDAGFDLTAISMGIVQEHDEHGASIEEYVEYGTGLSIEIPDGYVGLLFPRSSVSKYGMSLCNSVGVIDSGYRGEVKLRFYATDKVYLIGDKIGQLVIMPYPEIDFVECNELSKSDRNTGGFGSTNK